MIKKLGASVLLVAAMFGMTVVPASSAEACGICWPTPGAR